MRAAGLVPSRSSLRNASFRPPGRPRTRARTGRTPGLRAAQRERHTARAMSQENVDLVRDAFQALAAEGVEASLSFFAPECVWYTTDRWLDGSAYRGHDGIRRLDAAFAENFDDWRFEVRSIRDAHDRVVALTGWLDESGLCVIGQPGGGLRRWRFSWWDDREHQSLCHLGRRPRRRWAVGVRKKSGGGLSFPPRVWPSGRSIWLR